MADEITPAPPTTQPLTEPAAPPAAMRDPNEALKVYDAVSQTVGGVPSIRWRDNLFQALFVIGSTVIGGMIGLMVGSWIGAAVGAVGGMVASTFLSGVVLMVLGWVRVASNR